MIWILLAKLSLLLSGEHIRAFQHLCADHLVCFFPCSLHLRGKTGTEIVVKRFEQNYSSYSCENSPSRVLDGTTTFNAPGMARKLAGV